MDYAVAIIFFIVCFFVFYLFIYRYRKDVKADISEMEDVMPIMDQVKGHRMGKFEIFLPEADREAWNMLPRHVRRQRAMNQERMVKKGDLIQIRDENGSVVGLITRQEAIEKGVI